ncbi:hypothetical protein HAT86_02055 [Roseovarius gahaiensis]|uniref:Uncharacterized protein n=1 Tax=Roseovarius gahaiensis TaxID=2716691 RepID=A0A967EEZ2_9RHOB|nr:hypothetical protein [Roseovarius gahaiensis]NHQ73246.1 hypothetical protein [Roseovarius gahaiensis]
MRDMLNNAMPMLIWITTGFFILSSCFSGAMIIRYGGAIYSFDIWAVIGGFLTIIFGVTMSFVFAGICFQIMDIREFTKHTAIGLRKSARR